MKTKALLLMLALCAVAVAVLSADSPQMGTWKLNEAKSKIAPGAGKNTTVTYEDVGDKIKVTVEGTDASGNPSKNEWTGMFDGKPYEVTGEPAASMRTYKMVNARTLTFVEKSGGKITISGRIVVSPDGMSRTVTTTSIDSKGMKTHSTAVYDKQM
jgi:hypothetical protein